MAAFGQPGILARRRRDHLECEGKWDAFCARVTELDQWFENNINARNLRPLSEYLALWELDETIAAPLRRPIPAFGVSTQPEGAERSPSVPPGGGAVPTPPPAQTPVRELKPGEVLPDMFEGRPPTSKVVDIEWVYSNLAYNLNDIDYASAPSPGAVALLKWARTGNQTEFFKGLYAKLLPNRSSVTEDDDKKDDGRRIGKVIDLIEGLKFGNGDDGAREMVSDAVTGGM